MIRISGVSFLWEAIDAGYRGHTSISNRELDGHSRFIIPRRSLRAWKIRCCCRPVSSRSSPSISSPRSTVCPFRSAQEPLHKWPCPSFKITTNDQGRASPPFDFNFNFNFNFLPSFLSTLWSVPLIVCHVWTILSSDDTTYTPCNSYRIAPASHRSSWKNKSKGEKIFFSFDLFWKITRSVREKPPIARGL